MTLLMSPETWGLVAGTTGLAGYVPYLRDAWRRASDPDPAAWLIWAVEYSILLAAQVGQNAPWAALWLAALQLAGTVAVLAVLAARGGWRFSAGRWVLLGCGAAVMAAWPFAHAPAAAMCLALAVEGAGMIMVMVNAYRRPDSETLLTWEAFSVAGLLDLPALGQHSPRLLYAYPAFFVIMGAGVLIAAALGARTARIAKHRRRYYPRYRRPVLLSAPPARPSAARLPAGRHSAAYQSGARLPAARPSRGRERPGEFRERERERAR